MVTLPSAPTVAVTRFGNVYGGGDLNLSRIVPGTIRALLLGESPVIRSDGTMTRDYLYVEDVAAGYLRLAEALDDSSLFGQVFNFSGDTHLTVLEIVARISELMGCAHVKPEIRNTARADILHQHLSSAKAHRILGWKTEVSIDEGLRRTIAWYRCCLGKNPSPARPDPEEPT